jgi:tRNA A37 threonylcarbamoyladenosine modification protein TsaB
MLFKTILETYVPRRLFFARGPGSFMSIKISYIFLKTISISFGIPLLACDGFAFNDGSAIKAMRNLYFVKKDGVIATKRLDEPVLQPFCLPRELDESLFSNENEPLYLLPAV